MRPITCIAIDDEPMALLIIEQFCKRKGGMILTTYSEPNVGFKAITEEKPDLVFLDIQMDDINGLQIAGALPKGIFFIFSTAHAHYALKGFDLNAVDFLVKPFSYERFDKAVDKAIKCIEVSETLKPLTLIVKEEYNNISISVEDILYIEALGNYIKIYRENNRNVMTRMKMKEIQEMLPVHSFVRIHRSFIVSVSKIEKFNKNNIKLKGMSKLLPVGKCYIEDLKHLF